MPIKKHTVSIVEKLQIESEAAAAREFLLEDRFKFIRDLLLNAQTYAKESILNNTVRDVQEIVPITEKITKVFRTTKKVQVDELSGQYKLVEKFFNDVNYYVTIQEELEKALSNKEVVLEQQ